MRRKNLCPNCEIGKNTYEIDGKTAECPYLYCHNGKKCTMYRKINKSDSKRGVLKMIMTKIEKFTPPENEDISAIEGVL